MKLSFIASISVLCLPVKALLLRHDAGKASLRSPISFSSPRSPPSHVLPTVHRDHRSLEGIWVNITFDDFEDVSDNGGFGSFQDGGSDAKHVTNAAYSHNGVASIELRDGSGISSSIYHRENHDVSSFSQLVIEFWFYFKNMNTGEAFFLEYSADGGSSWTAVKEYERGQDFDNNIFYWDRIYLNETDYNLSTMQQFKLRFRCDASNKGDLVYLDEILFQGRGFEGTQEPSLSPSPSGSPPSYPTANPSSSASPSSVPSQVASSGPTLSNSPTEEPTMSPPTTPGITIPVGTAADIATAMQTAQAGDTLLMTNGPWQDQDIFFVGNGASGNPIVLQAETPGSVVLTNDSRLHISGTYLVVDGLSFEGSTSKNGIGSENHVIEFRTSTSDFAHHCRLTNTAIVDYNPRKSNSDYRWVGIYGTNNRVDHCYFSGKTHKGPLLVVWRPTASPVYHKIDHNYFGDFASGGDQNGWETIRIGTSDFSLSDSFTTVERNLFLRCNGEVEIISVKSGNNTLRGNTFDSCEGALTLRHGEGNTVDGNFFFGRGLPDTGGIRIIDSDHFVYNNYLEGLRGTSARAAIVLANGLSNSALTEYFPVERVTVAFNTIYDCKEAFRIGWRSSNDIKVKDSTIANNAVVSFAASGALSIINEEDAPINMLYEGNIMYGGSSNTVPLGISPTPAGINEIDPLLVHNIMGDGLYRPKPESSCRDGAVGSYPTVLFDMDGQARPTNSKDIGADEETPDHNTSGPLTLNDVGVLIGPSWM